MGGWRPHTGRTTAYENIFVIQLCHRNRDSSEEVVRYEFMKSENVLSKAKPT